MRRSLPVLCGVVTVVLLATLASLTGAPLSRPGAPRAERAPVTDRTLVCPDAGGSHADPTRVTIADAAAVTGADAADRPTVTVRALEADRSATPAATVPADRPTVTFRRPGGPLLVTASGLGAGAVAAIQTQLRARGLDRGLLSSTCAAPASDWWFTGTQGGVAYDDELRIVNAGGVPAQVTVTGWSARGPLDLPRLQAIDVAPGASTTVSVGAAAPDETDLTLHVHANTGQVVAALLDQRHRGNGPGGVDWIAPTLPPATDLVVTGWPAGTGSRRLVLTAPGLRDADVKLQLLTRTGAFAPAGSQEVLLRAGHSSGIQLADALAGDFGAVRVTSDQPVTAAGLTADAGTRRSSPDVAWQPAAQPLDGTALLPDNHPPFGADAQVYLTAVGRAADVTLAASGARPVQITVPPDRTVRVDLRERLGRPGLGAVVLTIRNGTVYAERTLTAAGAHGPLRTTLGPVPPPPPVFLPVVVPDPRVGPGS